MRTAYWKIALFFFPYFINIFVNNLIGEIVPFLIKPKSIIKSKPRKWANWLVSGQTRGPSSVLGNRHWSFLADDLVPELRVGGDEVLHQPDAARIVDDLELDAPSAEVVFGALEGAILADDDAWHLVEQGRPAAHVAGGEGRVEDAALVLGDSQAAGVFEAIHLGVEDGAAPLDASVVAAADDFAVEDEYRADGNSAFGQAELGFAERFIEERIGHSGSGVASWESWGEESTIMEIIYVDFYAFMKSVYLHHSGKEIAKYIQTHCQCPPPSPHIYNVCRWMHFTEKSLRVKTRRL